MTFTGSVPTGSKVMEACAKVRFLTIWKFFSFVEVMRLIILHRKSCFKPN